MHSPIPDCVLLLLSDCKDYYLTILCLSFCCRTIFPDEIKDTMQKRGEKSKVTKSKIAAAKKILNKKIKVNSHVKFDQDESSESDSYQVTLPVHTSDSIAPIPIEDCKDTTAIGGIELTSAKKTLRVRDKLDRKRERERIQTAHKERRRKARSSEKGQSSGIVTIADDTESESECEPAAKHTKYDEQLGAEETQNGLGEDEELALHLLKH